MSRNLARTATTLAAAVGAAAGLAWSSPALAWPFGPAKPDAAAAPKTAAQPATPAAAPPEKASPEERAAADRLDPLSRSAFWAKEVDHNPTDAEAGVELAAALRLLGRYEEAAQAANRVLILHPDNLPALLETARAFIGAGKGFYALDPLKRASVAAPRDWRIYSLLGVAHEQNRQPEAAQAAYQQALALSPNNPAVLANLALWYAAHGDRAQAERLLRQAVAQPGAAVKERQDLALVLGMEGKLADAEQLMREDLPPQVADSNLAYLRAVAAEGH